MDEELFSGQKAGSEGTAVSPGEEARASGSADVSGFTSDAANMDRYDFVNMLAEARILDMAWIR